ncbi:hypothetical protein [Edaphobacter bradus]|nr:hypothetical protein [Edaphobacter bradus]
MTLFLEGDYRDGPYATAVQGLVRVLGAAGRVTHDLLEFIQQAQP